MHIFASIYMQVYLFVLFLPVYRLPPAFPRSTFSLRGVQRDIWFKNGFVCFCIRVAERIVVQCWPVFCFGGAVDLVCLRLGGSSWKYMNPRKAVYPAFVSFVSRMSMICRMFIEANPHVLRLDRLNQPPWLLRMVGVLWKILMGFFLNSILWHNANPKDTLELARHTDAAVDLLEVSTTIRPCTYQHRCTQLVGLTLRITHFEVRSNVCGSHSKSNYLWKETEKKKKRLPMSAVTPYPWVQRLLEQGVDSERPQRSLGQITFLYTACFCPFALHIVTSPPCLKTFLCFIREYTPRVVDVALLVSTCLLWGTPCVLPTGRITLKIALKCEVMTVKHILRPATPEKGAEVVSFDPHGNPLAGQSLRHCATLTSRHTRTCESAEYF